MKQGLQLKFGQQLTMTPQLQQAIRLLQLSSVDLQHEIQEALDTNPLLELESESEWNESNSETDSQNDSYTNGKDSSSVETSDALKQQEMPEDLPTDSTWDDTWSAGSSRGSGVAAEDDYVYQGATSESLQDYLRWQLQLSHFSETDEFIGELIIDAIDDSGYLTQCPDELLDAVQASYPECEEDELQCVLHRIQQFDPAGVASCSVEECLLFQLARLPDDTQLLEQTKRIISEFMHLLANRDYRTLKRKTRLNEEQLKAVMQLIHSLNPRPGDMFASGQADYVIPDISVRKENGRWIVTLNPDSVPKLRVNEMYASLSRGACSKEDSQYIRQHAQDARWFIRSIESRNETLLKVANCIVAHQQAFFEQGEQAMKPLILSDVAQRIDMHESTVSRVTTQKYMHTPRGVFELKYFFSSQVGSETGGEHSSTAIRALIKKLIADENPAKPLSDNKLVELISGQGIKVARRTVAKYREAMNIPPSNQRKSLL